MNDEAMKQLVFEANKNLKIKDIYKDNREVIRVSEVKITPEMEIEPEYLEVLIPKAEKHKKDFLRILLKTEFEDNAEHIYETLCRIKYADIEIVSESIRKNKLNRYQDGLNIAQLLFLLKTDIKKVFIKNSSLECELPNSITKEIGNKIEKRYISMALNLVPMTYEEAERVLQESILNPEFDFAEGPTGTTAWLCDYYGVTFDELMLAGEEELTADAIENFAEGNMMCEEITLEQIQNTINELQDKVKQYSRKGRPQKNERLYAALSVFTEITTLSKNKQFKTVYECLNYLNLIDDDIKEAWNENSKYPEIQYIKALYNRSKKYRTKFDEPLPF